MDSKEKKTLTISSNFKKKKIDAKPFNNIKGEKKSFSIQSDKKNHLKTTSLIVKLE